MEIRAMTREDVPFAVDITSREHWGYVDDDFLRMMELEPDGCLVGFDDDERIGMLTTINYGRTGWMGNVVVEFNRRKQNIGKVLVLHAVEYLKGLGVDDVGLYSYMDSIDFYKKIGFGESFRVSRLSARIAPKEAKDTTRARPEDMRNISLLDSRYFPGDRSRLLRKILESSPGTFFYGGEDDVSGYVAGFCSPKTCEIGPWVCDPTRQDLAEDLLIDCMNALESDETSVGIPSRNETALKIAGRNGFTKTFEVAAMFFGSAQSQMNLDAIFGIGSLEMG